MQKEFCMRTMRYVFLLCCGWIFLSNSLDVVVVAQERAKMRLCMVTLDDDQLRQVTQVLQKDLAWSNQFDVDVLVQDRINSRTALKRLAAQYSLVIFITRAAK